MPLRRLLAVTAIILCSALASAKKKAILPADVLRARTVAVIIDPSAGADIRDPNANRAARADVEKALDQWGRFALVQEALTADLVITVRKGNGKLVQPTIGGTPINGTPPVNGSTTSTPTQSTTRAGVRWGGGNPNDPSSAQPSTPVPQIEAGSSQDMFVVYRGTTDPNSSPLDAPSVWRYSGKDALASPSVPAVEAFRKLIAESEKELASHP
jgi:hypothetical protein